MVDRFFTVEYFESNFVELIMKLSSSQEFFSNKWLRNLLVSSTLCTDQMPGPVVQRLDNAIQRINHYPADSVVCFVNTYPLDSDLSGG